MGPVIGRQSVLDLAACYLRAFGRTCTAGYAPPIIGVDCDALRDYLFVKGYEEDFISAATFLPHPDALKRFIMALHGGSGIGSSDLGVYAPVNLDGNAVLLQLAADMLSSPPERTHRIEWFSEYIRRLQSSLELDGFMLHAGNLVASEDSVLDEEEVKGCLERAIEDLGFAKQPTGLHHLKQAEVDYLADRWDDSISQSRKFHEYVMQEVAATHHAHAHDSPLDPAVYDAPGQVRKYLRDAGLLNHKECAAFGALFSLFSETGSHPYVAEATQARLMWRLALTLSDFMLARLGGYLASTADQRT